MTATPAKKPRPTLSPEEARKHVEPRDARALRLLDDDDLVTAREAAILLRTNVNVLSLWARRCKGPRVLSTDTHMGFGVSFVRYRMGDLRAWIAGHTLDPATGSPDKGVEA